MLFPELKYIPAHIDDRTGQVLIGYHAKTKSFNFKEFFHSKQLRKKIKPLSLEDLRDRLVRGYREAGYNDEVFLEWIT